MLKSIEIIQYRKLKDLTINFNEEVNIISGTNGTCKSSLLYIISNSFQKVTKKNTKINKNELKKIENKERENCISIIYTINKLMNPKIESLTRGDEKYNNPAPNLTGILYKCKYSDDSELSFRRHNSGKNRFSLKPRYSKGSNEKLPAAPIIYLGLFRLHPYGEFKNDNDVKEIRNKLPEKYLNELSEIYKNFTNMEISIEENNKNINMGNIKNRGIFLTGTEGIDSNTISAGEDNLYIILMAITSLKYYYEIEKKGSILLIDEFDATLHPAYQIKLYELIREYSKKYNIQTFFTSHSLSLIEYALDKKDKSVFYLLKNFDEVQLIEDITMGKIEMWLKNQLKSDIYVNKKIPVYTEDEEAREFLKYLFEYFEKKEGVSEVLKYFHLVDIKISSEALKQIFGYDKILKNNISSISTSSICILDGDQNVNQKQKNQKDIDILNNIIYLPSNKSPEKLIFDYSLELYDNKNKKFWNNEELKDLGYNDEYFREHIKNKIEENEKKIEKLKKNEKSTKGKRRVQNKELFNEFIEFFRFVIKFWIQNNTIEVEEFYKKLKISFYRVAPYQKIDSKLWKEKE